MERVCVQSLLAGALLLIFYTLIRVKLCQSTSQFKLQPCNVQVKRGRNNLHQAAPKIDKHQILQSFVDVPSMGRPALPLYHLYGTSYCSWYLPHTRSDSYSVNARQTKIWGVSKQVSPRSLCHWVCWPSSNPLLVYPSLGYVLLDGTVTIRIQEPLGTANKATPHLHHANYSTMFPCLISGNCDTAISLLKLSMYCRKTNT